MFWNAMGAVGECRNSFLSENSFGLGNHSGEDSATACLTIT